MRSMASHTPRCSSVSYLRTVGLTVNKIPAVYEWLPCNHTVELPVVCRSCDRVPRAGKQLSA